MKKHLTLIFLISFLISFTLINIPYIKAIPSITYNAVTNIITVTGFTLILPCTFFDILNADIIGGWGVVFCSVGAIEQYRFDCRLVFGDGSTETHFADNNTQIIFSNISISGNGQTLIDVRANAYFTLGILIDENTKATTDGVSIFLSDTPYQYLRLLSGTQANSHLFIYSSQIINTDETVRIYIYQNGNSSAYSRFWNSQFINLDCIYLKYIDIYNVIWSGAYATSASFALAFRGLTISNDVTAYNNSVVFASTPNVPFLTKNVYARNNSEIILAYAKITSVNNYIYLINVDSDNWLIKWVNNPPPPVDNMIFRQYEFDLTVTFPNGTAINGTETNAIVEIQHYGNNSGIDYNATLNANGTINTTALSMGFYNYTGNDILYNYNPFNLRIYNVEGFVEYNGNFTLNKKEDLKIILQSQVSGVGGFSIGFLLALFIGGIIIIPVIAVGVAKIR